MTQIIKKRQATATKRRAKAGRVLRATKQEDCASDRCEIYVESVSSDGSKVMGGGDYASSKVSNGCAAPPLSKSTRPGVRRSFLR